MKHISFYTGFASVWFWFYVFSYIFIFFPFLFFSFLFFFFSFFFLFLDSIFFFFYYFLFFSSFHFFVLFCFVLFWLLFDFVLKNRKPLRMPVPPPNPHKRRKGTILKEALLGSRAVTMANLSFTLRGTDEVSSSWFTCRSVLINVTARRHFRNDP